MHRSYRRALRFVALAACAGLASACGSHGSAAATGSAAVTSSCQQVSAALSDGPDPDADPVGYAQAQVLPLRQIHPADKSLRAAIDDLASAYQQVAGTDDAGAAKQAVSQASKKVNVICPGAAS